MQLVRAQDIFDEAKAFLEGRTRAGEPHERDLNKARSLLCEILDHNLGSPVVLYVLGSLELDAGHPGLAITLLSQATQIEPKFGEAWNNLGLAFKAINNFEKAAACIEEAGTLIDNPDVLNNAVAVRLNRGTPEPALELVNRILEKHPDHLKAQFHKALALLEMSKWDEAWDWHESRLTGGGNEDIAHRNYHGPDSETPVWDGKTVGKLVIHGEQGLGDEIMFASCIPDAIKTGCDIIFEPSPRMEGVFQRAFPGIKVFGTNEVDGRRWIAEHGKPDFKIALGSLPKFFRRQDSEFPGSPYLIPDNSKRAWWGDKLKALGRRPNIGIAWQGGVISTRFDARSFHPANFKPLFESVDANWISLQYDKSAAECVKQVRDGLNVRIQHWPQAVEQINPATGKQSDLDELVALISKLDLVISCCQTAIHVAGALGVPTLCLTPSEPSWRYGANQGERMCWYSSVKLLRQPAGSHDWNPVMGRAIAETNALLASKESVACR